MKQNSSFFMVGTAATLSALIVANVLFGGIGTSLSQAAYAAMMEGGMSAAPT